MTTIYLTLEKKRLQDEATSSVETVGNVRSMQGDVRGYRNPVSG
jgi:hypothetical protein